MLATYRPLQKLPFFLGHNREIWKNEKIWKGDTARHTKLPRWMRCQWSPGASKHTKHHDAWDHMCIYICILYNYIIYIHWRIHWLSLSWSLMVNLSGSWSICLFFTIFQNDIELAGGPWSKKGKIQNWPMVTVPIPTITRTNTAQMSKM